MKFLLTILFLVFSSAVMGATCTTTTRTNYTIGQKLTSAALNADFNQLVVKSNAFDGGCVNDGSLEASALNAADFAAVTNGIHQGCPLVYVDANTIGIGSCILSVNGKFVKTTSQTNVAWGCSGCASELASTQYYIYAKNGSTGTILNLLLSTTVPGTDGYDGAGNKVLGLFYNNADSAILSSTVENWKTNGFVGNLDRFTFNFSDGSMGACTAASCTVFQSGAKVLTVTRLSAGNYTVTFRKTYRQITCSGNTFGGGQYFTGQFEKSGSFNTMAVISYSVASNTLADTRGTLTCEALE